MSYAWVATYSSSGDEQIVGVFDREPTRRDLEELARDHCGTDGRHVDVASERNGEQWARHEVHGDIYDAYIAWSRHEVTP